MEEIIPITTSSGTKSPLSIKIFASIPKEVPAAISPLKISPVEINRIESSIANLLSSKSPVVIQESQSGGGSPNYRGMEANRLLLIVDGIPLNNAIYRSGHLQNSATINPFFIKSVKFWKDSQNKKYNSAYFEHVYLAQQMGVELVEGSDLFVEKDKVIKWFGALRPIDMDTF